MKICIAGKKGVGKTRFYCALIGKKYVNKPTVDFHETIQGHITLIDTPAFDSPNFKQVKNYKCDLCWIFIDGSRPLSHADLDCINEVRRMNISFELIIGLGKQYMDEILAELPNNIPMHYVTTLKEIHSFKRQLFVAKDKIEDIIESEEEEEKPLKWVVVGRENAGKSTLVNYLMGYDRVKVSDIPGTTQHSVELCAEYEGEQFFLKDTAGVKRSNLSYIKYLLEKRALILFIIDGAKELTHSDKSLLSQIMEAGLACIIVMNKNDHPDFSSLMQFKLNKLYKFLPVLTISALTGEGVKHLVETAKEVSEKVTKRITTSKFNKWIEAEKHMFHGTKIKYACHIRTAPYEVAFFVSPMNTSKQVVAHLRNMFQAYFDLYGVCVKVLMRSARSSTRAAHIPYNIKQKRLAQRH